MDFMKMCFLRKLTQHITYDIFSHDFLTSTITPSTNEEAYRSHLGTFLMARFKRLKTFLMLGKDDEKTSHYIQRNDLLYLEQDNATERSLGKFRKWLQMHLMQR